MPRTLLILIHSPNQNKTPTLVCIGHRTLSFVLRWRTVKGILEITHSMGLSLFFCILHRCAFIFDGMSEQLASFAKTYCFLASPSFFCFMNSVLRPTNLRRWVYTECIFVIWFVARYLSSIIFGDVTANWTLLYWSLLWWFTVLGLDACCSYSFPTRSRLQSSFAIFSR